MKRIEAQRGNDLPGSAVPVVELIFKSRSGYLRYRCLTRIFSVAQESQHWMSQGEVREEVDDLESILRPSLVFSVSKMTLSSFP